MKNANSKAKNITGTFLKKEPKKLYNYNSYKNEKAPYAEKDNSKGQGRRNFGQYNSHYIVNFHFIKQYKYAII